MQTTTQTDKKDPRYNNVLFNTGSISQYFDSYQIAVNTALGAIDRAGLEATLRSLQAAVLGGKTVYSIGNGGSASIADQLATDWTKGTFVPGKPALKTRSLSANTSVITAFGNDFAYEEIFSRQLQMLASPKDVLLAITSSGNSPNIVRAVETAKKMGMITIGMTGFEGGKVKPLVDISLHVGTKNYGVVEDCHQGLMHCLAQYMSHWLEGLKPETMGE